MMTSNNNLVILEPCYRYHGSTMNDAINLVWIAFLATYREVVINGYIQLWVLAGLDG